MLIFLREEQLPQRVFCARIVALLKGSFSSSLVFCSRGISVLLAMMFSHCFSISSFWYSLSVKISKEQGVVCTNLYFGLVVLSL